METFWITSKKNMFIYFISFINFFIFFILNAKLKLVTRVTSTLITAWNPFRLIFVSFLFGLLTSCLVWPICWLWGCKVGMCVTYSSWVCIDALLFKLQDMLAHLAPIAGFGSRFWFMLKWWFLHCLSRLSFCWGWTGSLKTGSENCYWTNSMRSIGCSLNNRFEH